MKGRSGFFGRVRLVFFTVAACVSLESGADAAALTGAVATEVTISECSSKDLSLVMQIHAGRIFIDYERRGFFRIGLLPLLVVENVHVGIQSVEYLTNALADLRFWQHPPSGVHQLELRNLEIIICGEKQPRLHAATAHVGQEGVIKLSNVSVRDAAGLQISLPKATLQISGPSAGKLCWNFDGHPGKLLVFQSLSDKTP